MKHNAEEGEPEPAHLRKPGPVEKLFERVLLKSRFLVLLAVIPSILGAFVLFVIASMDIFGVMEETWHYYVTGSNPVDIHNTVVPDIVGAVDIYLIALVLLIFGLGTYKLFISKLEPSDDGELINVLNIKSIDELKDKIARVVILALIIEFFRAVVGMQFDTPLNAIYLAASVLALAAAIFLMNWTQKA